MSDLIDREALLRQIDIDSEGEPGYYGDTWKFIDTIKMMPSALSTNLAEVGTDCISRQAAIDIERNATVDTNPSHFEAHQKFTQFMDDVEISSFGRWQWSNGFNTALTAVGIDLKKLPSAQLDTYWKEQCQSYEQTINKLRESLSTQPEIIRCKDCKYARLTNDESCKYCDIWFPDEAEYMDGDYYCASAERKSNG